MCETYFVNRVDFDGGIIIAVSIDHNEIGLITKVDENKFIPFKCLSFEFDNTLSCTKIYIDCISNGKSSPLNLSFSLVYVKKITVFCEFVHILEINASWKYSSFVKCLP